MAQPTNNTFINPVILCGGSGTRLWPLSRSKFPKQFLVLSDHDSKLSLFQQAIARINGIGGTEIHIGSTFIVTNEEHRFLALDQLRELKGIQSILLLEPAGRNTAPALSLAALQALDNQFGKERYQQGCSDPILVISPADQKIENQIAFTKALQNCVAVVADDSGKKTIAILGITPTAPETGYGYIQHNPIKGKNNEFVVAKFVEKPDANTAQTYISDGNYLWNSGIFVLRASTWLAALDQFRPDIVSAIKEAWNAKTIDQFGDVAFIRPDKEFFTAIPSESIDYAVIEKCAVDNGSSENNFIVKMVELDAGWNDLGAWEAVWQLGEHDAQGNVTSGDSLLVNSKNSLIHSTSRLVSAVGVENLIIVEMVDSVLVADRKNSQDIKSLLSLLKAQQRVELDLHRKVARPWGWYDSVDSGDSFKVKRIQVNPGASLSLQMHNHRAEHWIVVKGVAEVTIGDQIFNLAENQSTYIPQGQVHRLANPGEKHLEIIEVQTGSRLDEDDIVRFEDKYGRG